MRTCAPLSIGQGHSHQKYEIPDTESDDAPKQLASG
jgi:hypothetical protein